MGHDTSYKGALKPSDFSDPAAGGNEKRREQRFVGQKTLNLLPCSARDEWQFESVQLTDCSLNGLGFLANEPMRPGEQFLVKLLVKKKLRLLIYTVRNCRQLPTREYRIGAEYTGHVAAPCDDDPHELLAEFLRRDDQGT